MPQSASSKTPLKTVRSRKQASEMKVEERSSAYSIVTLHTDAKGKAVRDSQRSEREFNYETVRG